MFFALLGYAKFCIFWSLQLIVIIKMGKNEEKQLVYDDLSFIKFISRMDLEVRVSPNVIILQNSDRLN